jgi:membrane protease YdiL (CAAX protease family)
MSVDEAPSFSPGSDQAPEGNRRSFGWIQACLIFVVYEVGQLGGGAVVGLFAGAVWASRGVSLQDPAAVAQLRASIEGPSTLAGLVVGGAVMVLVTRRFALHLIRQSGPLGIGWGGARARSVVVWGSLGIALSALFQIALRFEPSVPYEDLGPLSKMAAAGGTSRLYWVACAFLAPPLEEFLFRGALLSGLTRSFGVATAAVIVTVAFTALHFPEASATRVGLPAIFLIAVATLAARLRSGALPAAISLHLAYNAFTVAGLYLADR